jgi:hypothetical protein
MASCRSCGAEIRWALTERGKHMPIDPAPVSDGNLVLVFINGDWEVRHATADDRKLKRELYKSHFSTCPDAAQHRSR